MMEMQTAIYKMVEAKHAKMHEVRWKRMEGQAVRCKIHMQRKEKD